MKTIEITMNRIQNSSDGVSLNKGLLKELQSIKIEGLRIRYIFFSGIECGFVLSNVKCFIEA